MLIIGVSEIKRRYVPFKKYWIFITGGYAYRLCKLPSSSSIYHSELNEDCFSKGYLEFVGENQWFNYYREDSEFDEAMWTERKAQRYTTPTGSQWTVIEREIGGIDDADWVFRDLVAVPETLEPGQYVLSMRWDSENSPQIWSSCSNIEIVWSDICNNSTKIRQVEK